MARIIRICIGDITANLKTKVIVVHAGITNSLKNQCKHITCDPICVSHKNMLHSEIK